MANRICTKFLTEYGSPVAKKSSCWSGIFAHTLWQAGGDATINFKTSHYLMKG